MRAVRTRRFRAADIQTIRDILCTAIRIGGRAHYTPEQIEIWLSATPSLMALYRRLSGSLACRVAFDQRGVYAFANISRAGHVDFVMCHPRRARRGVNRPHRPGESQRTAII